MVTPTKVQWDAGKIKSTTRESLKQENQETKAQLPLGICFEKKPKVWTEEQERGFRQKAPLVQGQLGRASYRLVVEEKTLDAEGHCFSQKHLGFWIVV